MGGWVGGSNAAPKSIGMTRPVGAQVRAIAGHSWGASVGHGSQSSENYIEVRIWHLTTSLRGVH